MTTEQPIDPTVEAPTSTVDPVTETAEAQCAPPQKYTPEEFEAVQRIAYEVWEGRLDSGEAGDDKTDWAEAESVFARNGLT